MYPCHQCNLNAGQQSYSKTHIESVHEKVNVNTKQLLLIIPRAQQFIWGSTTSTRHCI